MTNQNDSDTTIDDTHRTRERLAAKFGDDIKAILADARRQWRTAARLRQFCGPDA